MPHALAPACAAALLAGALAGLLLPSLPSPWLRGTCVLAGVLGWAWPWRGRAAGALLAGLGWALLHAGWALAGWLPVALEGAEVRVTGKVLGLPQHEARRTRFDFRVADEAPEPLRGRRLQLAWYDDFGAERAGPRMALRPGSRWSLQLKLRAPRGLSNPGGFDAGRHALAQRIAAAGYVRSPALARQLAPASGVDAWRARMAGRIDAAVGSPSSRFVRALALGDTRGLSDDDWEALRAVGLTHLIAISGFHVGLVAGFCALAGGGAVVVVAGAGPALAAPAGGGGCRGARCGGLCGGGRVRPADRAHRADDRGGRRRTPGPAAAGAVAGPVAGAGGDAAGRSAGGAAGRVLAQLRRGGVAGVVPAGAGAAALAARLPRRAGRGHPGLLPLGAVLFLQASLAGPLANLLAVPWWSLVVVPLSLLGTGLEAMHAGAGGWAWRAAAWCFEPSWALFERMAASPLALWWLPEARGWALPLALAGAFWLLLPRGVPGKALAALLWVPLLWPPRELPARGGVELHVLDAGQGLAVVVRTARHALLYDAGPAVRDGWDAGERAVLPALRALGIRRLDRVVISHADQGPCRGWPAVQRGLPVVDSRAPAGAPLDVAGRLITGRGWEWDGVVFRFLHPPPHFPYLRNEASCVLRIESAHGAILLPGDIGEVVEARLLRDPAQLRADVVVVPHHGSDGSSSAAFVAATGARVAVVAAGYGNRFGHPREAVVHRWRHHGAEVLATPGSGAVRIWLDGGGLAVRERRSWRPRLWDPREPPP